MVIYHAIALGIPALGGTIGFARLRGTVGFARLRGTIAVRGSALEPRAAVDGQPAEAIALPAVDAADLAA